MPRDSTETRRNILEAADILFYSESLRSVSIDDIAEKAGVTKKTLYYHFRSKDELIAAYLEARDQPALTRFQQWAGDTGTVAERMERMFDRLSQVVKLQSWKGCGFIRATGELAGMPGHPAVVAARAHKLNIERWLSAALQSEGRTDGESVARELIVLIDGAVTQMLLHRNGAYAKAAGRAAKALLSMQP